jgi:hypothetical protein
VKELFVRSKHHVMRIGPTSVEGHPGMLGHRVERTGKKPKKEPLPMPYAWAAEQGIERRKKSL